MLINNRFNGQLFIGNNVHFGLTNGCSCESVAVLRTGSISIRRGCEPPTCGFMPNNITFELSHFPSRILITGSCGLDSFVCTFSNWTLTQSAAFIFDSRPDVIVEVSKFWDGKYIDLRGARTPNLRIQAAGVEFSKYQARHCSFFIHEIYRVVGYRLVRYLNWQCVIITA